MIRPILLIIVLALIFGLGGRYIGKLSGNERLRLANSLGYWLFAVLLAIAVTAVLTLLL